MFWDARLLRRSVIAGAFGTLWGAEGLPRRDLMVYRDSSGRVRPVRSVRDWERRRAEVLKAMQQVMGPLPGADRRCPLDLKVEDEVDAGSYVRRLVTYASEPGCRVPAYLLVPRTALEGRRAPAVLCLHPTDNKIGHGVVVGLGGAANRAYAAELANRGYVTLAPAYPLLANYQPDLKALGYQSGTMKAIWDNMRGLDLLEQLPYVQTTRGFGVIGHSLGGHNGVYTAVFEPRLRIVVSSCGLDSYVDYQKGDIRGWTSERYMPGLLAYRDRLGEIPFDFPEMVGALAPRQCFISAPVGDTNFSAKSVDDVAAAARAVYRLYGRPDDLVVKHPNGGHDFPEETRRFAYELFDRHFGLRGR